MLEGIKERLKGKVVIVGIGNTLRGDDAAGAVLASRIKDLAAFEVIDAGSSPENYLEKIVKGKPDTILLVDAADFGGMPGELRVLPANQVETANLFFTHNASISLAINYLQTSLKADIIVLIIQPKSVVFSEQLSAEVTKTITELTAWFYGAAKEKA